MTLRKYAAVEVLDSWTANEAGLRRTAHKHTFEYTPREGFLYVRSRAISSRINDNFDHFPAEEIAKSYMTFVGKPVFVNHHNDNHRRARGVIIDAALHEDVTPQGLPDTWVEVLMEIDAVRFPKLAQAILAGHIDRTSMGVDVASSQCSACGNVATTPLEYCAHIPAKKGQKLRRIGADGAPQDQLIYETCRGLHFFENSVLVEDPADPTAFVTGVDDRGLGGGYSGDLLRFNDPDVTPGLAPRNARNHGLRDAEASSDIPLGELTPLGPTTASRRQRQHVALDDDDIFFGEAAGRVVTASQTAASLHHVGRVLGVGAEDPMRRVVAQHEVAGVPHHQAGRNRSDELGVAPAMRSHGRPSGVGERESSVSVREGATSPRPARVRSAAGVDFRGVPLHLGLGSHEALRRSVSHGEEAIGPADHDAYFLGVDDRGVGGGYVGNVPHAASRKTATPRHETTNHPKATHGAREAAMSRTASRRTATIEWKDLGSKGWSWGDDGSDDWVIVGGGRHQGGYGYHGRIDGTVVADSGYRTLDEAKDAAERDIEGVIAMSASRHTAAVELPAGYVWVRVNSHRARENIERRLLEPGEELLTFVSVSGPAIYAIPEAAWSRLQSSTGHIRKGIELVRRPPNLDGYMKPLGRSSSRRVAYGETVAPAEVNTLREQSCPVCSDERGFNGEKCNVCGYIKPPDMFMDPDLEKAKETDLRQRVDEIADEATGGDDYQLELEGDEKEIAPDGGFHLEKEPEAETDPAASGIEAEVQGQDDAIDTDETASAGEDGEGDEDDDLDVDVDVDVDADAGDEGSDDDEEDDDESDEDEDDGFTLRRKKQSTIARRNRAEETVMRKNLSAVASLAAQNRRQAHALRRQAIQINAQQRMIDTIATLAGIDLSPIKREAARRVADLENPAQPIPEPETEAASESSEEALGDISSDRPGGGGESVEKPGVTDESDASPTATDDVTVPGSSDQVPDGELDLSNDDVTKPVEGASEPIPVADRRTEGDVTAIDEVRTETAFPIEDASQTQKVEAAQQRVFASLRLARLQIQAGIESGNDLALGQKIATSEMTDREIASQIQTLEAVAAHRPAQSVPAASRVARTVPSMASARGLQREASAPTSAQAAHIAEVTEAADLFLG